MGIHTADAIVLRRYLYRETSVIIACLTDRYGKLKGLVKGLRMYPNRHRSAMEPLTINRLVFYDTHESQLHLVSQCELLHPLRRLERDVEVFHAAARMAELTDAILPLEEPAPATYDLLRQSLERLEQGTLPRAVVALHFLARLLRLAGFQPQVTECAGCGIQLQAAGYWSIAQGGLLCPACLHEDPKAEPVGPAVLDALQQLGDALAPPAMEPPLVASLQQRLDQFLQWRLDRPLKTQSAEGSRLKAQGSSRAAFGLQPSA